MGDKTPLFEVDHVDLVHIPVVLPPSNLQRGGHSEPGNIENVEGEETAVGLELREETAEMRVLKSAWDITFWSQCELGREVVDVHG